MVNGVLTIPLSGMSFGSSQAAPTRAQRLTQFVAGPENALAVAALSPLLDSPSSDSSPLLLYGPHGSGKSHLARGLADWWRRRIPTAIACCTGGEFARQHAAALRTGRWQAWRDEVRGAGLFILDDLGELADKRPAQQELLHVLDTLADNGALAVVTARTFPGHWPALLPALRGRLSAGLAVPLAFPNRDARRVILERLAAVRGVALAANSLDGLASGLHGSVPELIAAMQELELAQSVPGEVVDPTRIREIVSQRTAAQPTLRQVASLTARYFGFKVSDLKSPGRQRSLVASRGVAMYLARHLTGHSLGQIGTYFGGRDHTTVLYGCRRTEHLIRSDRAIHQAVAELHELLTSS